MNHSRSSFCVAARQLTTSGDLPMHCRPRRSRCFLGVIGLLLIAILPCSLQGQTVTFRFTGQVDGLLDDLAFFTSTSVGSPFTVDL